MQNFAVEEIVFVPEIVALDFVAEMFEFVKEAASVEFVENRVVDTVVCVGETFDNFVVEAVHHNCETDVVFVQLAYEDIAESIVVASVAHTFEIGIVFQTIAAYVGTVDGAEVIAENITVAVEIVAVDFG